MYVYMYIYICVYIYIYIYTQHNTRKQVNDGDYELVLMAHPAALSPFRRFIVLPL